MAKAFTVQTHTFSVVIVMLRTISTLLVSYVLNQISTRCGRQYARCFQTMASVNNSYIYLDFAPILDNYVLQYSIYCVAKGFKLTLYSLSCPTRKVLRTGGYDEEPYQIITYISTTHQLGHFHHGLPLSTFPTHHKPNGHCQLVCLRN